MMTSTDIRKDARNHLTNKWGKGALITFCYFIIEFAFNLLSNFTSNIPVLGFLVSIGIWVISLPISYGLIISFMKLKRNEEIKSFDFLSLGFSNFSRAWKVFFSMFIKLIIPFILTVVSCIILAVGISFSIFSSASILTQTSLSNSSSKYYADLEEAQLNLAQAKTDYLQNKTTSNRKLVEEAQEKLDEIKSSQSYYTSKNNISTSSSNEFLGLIISLIGIILLFISGIYTYIKTLSFVLSYNIAYDEPDLTGKEIVLKSKTLMNGNKGNYFVLTLSFIGWAILSVLTLGIGYFWLLPYMQISFVCFYDNLKDNNKDNSEPIVQ